MLLDFKRTTFSGQIVPVKTAANFQLISGNYENSGAFATCKRFDAWNGFYCNNDQLAIVSFESFDDDKYKRILSPIIVRSMNGTARNVLNTFMDH